MKLHLQKALLCTVFLFLSTVALRGQNQIDRDSPHAHRILQQIDKDYRAGQLSLDQKVLYKLYASQNPNNLPAKYRPQDELPIKCGTPAIIDYYTNRDRLSAATTRRIESMMQATSQMQENYQSGRFNIQYEITGEHAVPMEDANNNDVPDYVEEVAAAADSSYRHEVETLGYTDPLNSGAIYDIEIRDLNFYGQTVLRGGTTAIQIENDFEGFPSNTDPEGDQIGAVKVTMAHEFKHAIQYAATSWSGETDLWAEMDATLMEEVVYDDVNDYYNYLENNDSIFFSPHESFYPGSYYHVSWALYFEEQYGPEFWPGVWDIINDDPDIRMVSAMREQLGDNISFNQSFVESQLWHYASGPRNSPVDYGFEERNSYPTPVINFSFIGEDSLNTSQEEYNPLEQLAAHFINVDPSPFKGYATVELTDISSTNTIGVGIIGYLNDGTTETVILDPQERDSFEYQTTWRWKDLNRIGITVSNSDESEEADYKLIVGSKTVQTITLEQNYPNPFYPTTTIRFNIPEPSTVQLKVYDITGRLIRTLRDEELPAGIYENTIEGSDLAAGIYLYRLSVGQQSFVKKMTLIK